MIQTASTPMNRSSLAVLSLGHVCIDVCQGAIPALIPFILLEQHLSYATAGSLILITNLASSIIQPLFGQLADRHTMAWIMPVGLLVAGTGIALAGLAPTYGLIAFSVAIAGSGIAAFHPEAARLVNVVAGQKKAVGMSIFSMGGNIGFALGPLMITALIALWGLHSTWLILLPITIIALLIMSFSQRFSVSQTAHQSKNVSEILHSSDAWGAFTRITVVIIIRSIIFYGLNTFIPLYWIAVLHQNARTGDIALTVLLIASIVGTLIGGQLADRYGRRVVVFIALAMLTPFLILFLLYSPFNSTLAMLLLLPVGIALSAPFSVMVLMGQEYLPNHVGTASGVTLGLAVTVGGITVPLFGHIADLYSLHTSLVGLALLPLFGFGCALTLPKTK